MRLEHNIKRSKEKGYHIDVERVELLGFWLNKKNSNVRKEKSIFDLKKKIQFILVQSCQTHKRQSKAMGPLYLEGGSFIGLGIHITQKLQRRAKEKKEKKKAKTKELKFI